MIGQEPKGSNYLPLLSNPGLVLRSLEMEKKRYNPDLRSSCLVVGCVCVMGKGHMKTLCCSTVSSTLSVFFLP